jgi:hypothetical protein
MNKLLKEFISYILFESSTSDQAKKMGLTSMGFGRWGKDNKVTHKTINGKLVPIKPREVPVGKGKPSSGKKDIPASSTKKQKLPKVPQSAEVPMSDAPGNTPPQPLPKGSAAKDEEILKNTEAAMESRGFDTPEDATRFEAVTKLWKSFLGAPSYEEQVKAVRAMAELKLIQGGASGKKIYMAPTTGLVPKHLCGTQGTAVTRLMNKIIADEGIEVDMRGSAADRALADLSGKHNEAGVTAYLFPSKENQEAYKGVEGRYSQLGGDARAADARNKAAAEAVQSALPKGAKITNATQVGGAGATGLQKLGIDPKTDPTDIIVEYEVGGKKQMMKISAKIYTDPRNITMKNSGVKRAGVDYLGEPGGSNIDKEWPSLVKKYKWSPDMPEEEKKELKSKLKQAYLKKYAGEMEKLADSEAGQRRLLKMWQSVHGCGKNVHTLVINKSTNESSLKSPSHYCSPKTPFKVKYDGVKVVIEMSTGGPQTLQIDLKTEDKGSPKLLFRHIVRDKK